MGEAATAIGFARLLTVCCVDDGRGTLITVSAAAR